MFKNTGAYEKPGMTVVSMACSDIVRTSDTDVNVGGEG